jgi:hypothetical protein
MKNIEFDFKHDLFDKKTKYMAITEQLFKAYVWYHENLKHTEGTLVGLDAGKVPVLDMTLELTGDELEFMSTALKNEFRRRY